MKALNNKKEITVHISQPETLLVQANEHLKHMNFTKRDLFSKLNDIVGLLNVIHKQNRNSQIRQ